MYLFWFFLIIVFLWINLRILFIDIYQKRIPNKLLGYLLGILPFWYLYLFAIGSLAWWNTFIFFIQILTSLLISFLLYYFSVWSAGDAKYLLVLALFIPSIGIVPFIWNIVLLTMLYLWIYFVYFYLWKWIISQKHKKVLWNNLKNTIYEKYRYFFRGNKESPYNKKEASFHILKHICIFLLIFVVIRLSRIYILRYVYSQTSEQQQSFVFDFIQKHHIYVIMIWIWVFYSLSIYRKEDISIYQANT